MVDAMVMEMSNTEGNGANVTTENGEEDGEGLINTDEGSGTEYASTVIPLGEKIGCVRRTLNLSQTDLAEMMSISRVTLSSIENNGEVSTENCMMLIHVMECIKNMKSTNLIEKLAIEDLLTDLNSRLSGITKNVKVAITRKRNERVGKRKQVSQNFYI